MNDTLIIKGIDVNGDYTGTVDFYLADYRFDNNSEDYIIDNWTWVDLSLLGDVVGLEFSIDSSDKEAFGINTPAYFAMDNLNAVPIPGDFDLDGDVDGQDLAQLALDFLPLKLFDFAENFGRNSCND